MRRLTRWSLWLLMAVPGLGSALSARAVVPVAPRDPLLSIRPRDPAPAALADPMSPPRARGGVLMRPWSVPGEPLLEGTWTELPPPRRVGATAAYDSRRDRVLLFGGYDDLGVSNDLWALSLRDGSWERLAPRGSGPSPRYGASAVVDPQSDRLLVFGGLPRYNDRTADLAVWALSLGDDPTWIELHPTSPSPSARAYAAVAVDEAQRRVLLLGGTRDTTYLGDLWALDLAGLPRWRRIAPAGGWPARAGAAAVVDPRRDELVVVGGRDWRRTWNDAWTIRLASLDEWRPVEVPGDPRFSAANPVAAYDPVRDALRVIDTQADSLLWTLDLRAGAWSAEVVGGQRPAPRSVAAAVHDPVHGRLIVSGGASGYFVQWDDTWSLTLGDAPRWSLLSAERPAPRVNHVAVADSAGDRMIVFGGADGGAIFSDVWAQSLAPDHRWTRLAPSDDGPGARSAMAGVLDARRRRVVVFGGVDSASTPRNDLWSLALDPAPAWERIDAQGGSPPGRWAASAIWDPARERLIVFAGTDGWSAKADVWALSLAGVPTWTRLAPSGEAPPARCYARAEYDPGGDRMIVFGGIAGARALGDAWALSLGDSAAWSRLDPVGGIPPLAGAASAYDPERGCILVHGGESVDSDLIGVSTEVYALSLGAEPAVTWIPTPAGSMGVRSLHTLVRDPRRGTFVGFGGSGWLFGAFDDTWILSLGPHVPVPPAPSSTGAMRLAPNPASVASDVSFSLAVASDVGLELLDVAGRRIGSFGLGRLAPGDHTFTLAGLADLADGVYLVRLTAAGQRTVRKLVVVRSH